MKKLIRYVFSVLLILGMVLSTCYYAEAKDKDVITPEQGEKLTHRMQEKLKENKDKNEKNDYKKGEAIILYHKNNGENSVKTTLDKNDIQLVKTWNFKDTKSNDKSTKGGAANNFVVSQVKSSKYSTEELVNILKKNDQITYAEPNYVFHLTDAKYLDKQWPLDNKGQNAGTQNCDINPEDAWSSASQKDEVVAIIDSGVDYTHEALKGNMWVNTHTNVLKGTYGYDCCNDDADPMDDNGHGTHCAGIVAGNNTYIKGVDPNVKIMALKYANKDGAGYNADAIEAYNYISTAIDAGVHVTAINNSWGGSANSNILAQVVNEVGKKGAVTVIAAGNSFEDVDVKGCSPWDFKSPYTIKVAASGEKDELTSFSCFGKQSVDLAAPGADILSTVSYDCYNPSIHEGDPNYSEIYHPFKANEKLSNMKTLGFDTTASNNNSVSISTSTNFGNYDPNDGALDITFDATAVGKYGAIYGAILPFTLPSSNTDYYYSLQFKLVGPEDAMLILADDTNERITNGDFLDSAITGVIPSGCNVWESFSDRLKVKSSPNDSNSMYFGMFVNKPGTYHLYIDAFGISKQNLAPSQFGKYAFYKGTSMAAPEVTGAVSLIRKLYPNVTADTIKDYTAKSVRKVPALMDKTISGGVLDLSMLNPLQSISFAQSIYQMDEGGQLQLTPTINPDNAFKKEVSYTSSDASITVDQNGLVKALAGSAGHKATITVTSQKNPSIIANTTVEVKQKPAPVPVPVPTPVTPANNYASYKVSGLKATQTTAQVKLSWKRVAGASGYTIYCQSGKKQITLGSNSSVTKTTYTVKKIKGKKLKSATAYTFKVAPYTVVSGKKIYGKKVTIKTGTKPGTAKISSAKRSGKKVKLSVNKVVRATGFKIYIKVNKKGSYKLVKTVKGGKKFTCTIKVNKLNKNSAIRVRAYKTVNKKAIYGSYSKGKKLK
ncbi:protease [Lachnospiraceae bacterium KM106-2]|nr:protease [Lachnospiraceae bacterium KM106-2]